MLGEEEDDGDENPFAKLKSLTLGGEEDSGGGGGRPTMSTVLKVDNIESLTQASWSSHVPTGTIAFLEQEEEVLIRIMSGWQHFQVCSSSRSSRDPCMSFGPRPHTHTFLFSQPPPPFQGTAELT